MESFQVLRLLCFYRRKSIKYKLCINLSVIRFRGINQKEVLKMKNLLCISLVVFFTIVGCAFQKAWSDDLLTRDQAIAILIEQVITPMVYEDYYMAFGPQQMLTIGDRVESEVLGGQPYPG
jgi:hypothetical protein